MLCNICLCKKVDPQVRVLVAGRVVATFDSWLKAENWVLEQYERVMTKCSLLHVYVCTQCRKEDVRFEALFSEGSFVYVSHGEDTSGVPG